MSLADARQVVRAVEAAAARDDVAGVVVAHGTDTMEEVSFLSDLLVGTEKPVVFTGAQRAPGAPGFDGLVNLRDALHVALSPAGRGLGTVVVFGGKILSARHAVKTDTKAPSAFGPDWAVLGRVDEASVHIWGRPVRGPLLSCSEPAQDIELLTTGIGMGAELLRHAAQSSRGIVLQALGLGNVPPAMLVEAEDICAAGVPLVIAAGAGAGGTMPSYRSAARLRAAGAIFAENLPARKARILLAAALAEDGDGVAAVQAYLAAIRSP
ncbi:MULTISPECIES: asparaginase [Pacificimonas]|nr:MULTISPECIES: asparaginase domain-containing protein [Pacificimonas]MBZ6377144.1 asparaginase [Pacificimonas aurantium]